MSIDTGNARFNAAGAGGGSHSPHEPEQWKIKREKDPQEKP